MFYEMSGYEGATEPQTVDYFTSSYTTFGFDDLQAHCVIDYSITTSNGATDTELDFSDSSFVDNIEIELSATED